MTAGGIVPLSGKTAGVGVDKWVGSETTRGGVSQMLNLKESAPMFKVPLLSWIGNAAAVLLGSHGSVSEQAREAGCSRQSAYRHADEVQRALQESRLPGPSRAELLDEVGVLRRQLDEARRRDADLI